MVQWGLPGFPSIPAHTTGATKVGRGRLPRPAQPWPTPITELVVGQMITPDQEIVRDLHKLASLEASGSNPRARSRIIWGGGKVDPTQPGPGQLCPPATLSWAKLLPDPSLPEIVGEPSPVPVDLHCQDLPAPRTVPAFSRGHKLLCFPPPQNPSNPSDFSCLFQSFLRVMSPLTRRHLHAAVDASAALHRRADRCCSENSGVKSFACAFLRAEGVGSKTHQSSDGISSWNALHFCGSGKQESFFHRRHTLSGMNPKVPNIGIPTCTCPMRAHIDKLVNVNVRLRRASCGRTHTPPPSTTHTSPPPQASLDKKPIDDFPAALAFLPEDPEELFRQMKHCPGPPPHPWRAAREGGGVGTVVDSLAEQQQQQQQSRGELRTLFSSSHQKVA